MTEIVPVPCGGRIAVDTPGYRPCDDCQGLRALCGESPCPRADEFVTVPMRTVIPENLNSGFARHKNCPTFPTTYPDDDPSDPRPPGKSSDPAVQRWLYRRRKKAAGQKAVRTRGPQYPNDPDDPRPDKKVDNAGYQRWVKRQRRKLQAPETAEAIPEVVEAPETVTAPQERAPCDVLTDPVPGDPAIDAADEVPGEISNERALIEMMGAVAMASDAVRTRQPEPPADVLLPIPIDWIDSVTFNRDGTCQIWLDRHSSDELIVDPDVGDPIAALLRRAAPCR